jgi:ribosomal protein S18 acetylase RimI-like enzyme
MARVRPLSHDDIPEAAAILAQEGLLNLSGDTALDPQQALQIMCERRKIYVMEMDSSLAGVASFIPEPILAGGGCVQFLVIRKEMRRRGAGRQFLGFIERMVFRESGSIFLSVSAQDDPARLFFERLGYCKAGELPDRSGWILTKARKSG